MCVASLEKPREIGLLLAQIGQVAIVPIPVAMIRPHIE